MVVGVLALTGCGGGGGGGGDDDPKFPNPTIDIAVGNSGAEVTIEVTSMNGGREFYYELKFNNREPFADESRYGTENFDQQLQYKCYTYGTSGNDYVGYIYCEGSLLINGGVQTGKLVNEFFDGDINGQKVLVKVPVTGTNELKFIVTAVDNPITYVIPLEVEGGVLKFGAYTTR
jgi:hypothetical protein